MDKKELLKYGNELTICGFVVGNAVEHHAIYLKDEIDLNNPTPNLKIMVPDKDQLHQIIRQLDVQEIEGLQKVILRKSQRNIDQNVAWQVFRRDEFKCVYCGTDNVPMTIDHIVLWEHMGDTVPDNLNCSCKKCNKTRGSMSYMDWLKSDYMINIWKNISHKFMLSELAARWETAKELPLRKTKRSR